MTTFDPRTLDRWRGWLDKHHASETEVWLVFYKQHTGTSAVAYLDAVDEALCYGWIDSLVRRLDEDRYARKFTPRKANSKWNVRTYGPQRRRNVPKRVRLAERRCPRHVSARQVSRPREQPGPEKRARLGGRLVDGGLR